MLGIVFLLYLLPSATTGKLSLNVKLLVFITLPYAVYLFGYYAIYGKLPFKSIQPKQKKRD